MLQKQQNHFRKTIYSPFKQQSLGCLFIKSKKNEEKIETGEGENEKKDQFK